MGKCFIKKLVLLKIIDFKTVPEVKSSYWSYIRLVSDYGHIAYLKFEPEPAERQKKFDFFTIGLILKPVIALKILNTR